MDKRLNEVRGYLEAYGGGAISLKGNHEQENLIKLIEEIIEEAFDDGKDTMQLTIRNKVYGLTQDQMIRLNQLRRKYNLPKIISNKYGR